MTAALTAADELRATPPNAGIQRTFWRYLLPSVIGLLSISTASVVDGLLVARFIGPHALAAVNLLIPFITLYFGVGLMLAIGASVRAAYHLGAGDKTAASVMFSNTLLLAGIFAFAITIVAALFPEPLFVLLGAPHELLPLLKSYFGVLLLGSLPQLLAVVLYYGIRGVGYPRLATSALALGAAVNVVLDSVFLGVWGWDISAAAWATVAAQLTQCVVLFFIAARLPHGLFWRPRLSRLGEVIRAAANGFSEFVNEVSVGLVIGVLHWLLVRQAGAEALAGFALVNYALFINAMISCAVAEVVYTLVSQSMGSGDRKRAAAFVRVALYVTLIFAVSYTAFLLVFGPTWISALFPGRAGEFSLHYLYWLWPAFLACGCNLVLSARFTGLQNARASTTIALLRSLILPLLLICAFYYMGVPLVAAVPAAEWLTLLIAATLVAGFYKRGIANISRLQQL